MRHQRPALRAAFAAGRLIVLHTSVVLAYLNGTEAVAPAAAIVLDDLVASGMNHALISAVTVTEALVRPLRVDASAAGVVETFLQHFANLTVADVDFTVARAAAGVRATTGLKAPDAIVIATAMVHGAVLVANDNRWNTAVAQIGGGLELIHLDAFLPI